MSEFIETFYMFKKEEGDTLEKDIKKFYKSKDIELRIKDVNESKINAKKDTLDSSKKHPSEMDDSQKIKDEDLEYKKKLKQAEQKELASDKHSYVINTSINKSKPLAKLPTKLSPGSQQEQLKIHHPPSLSNNPSPAKLDKPIPGKPGKPIPVKSPAKESPPTLQKPECSFKISGKEIYFKLDTEKINHSIIKLIIKQSEKPEDTPSWSIIKWKNIILNWQNDNFIDFFINCLKYAKKLLPDSENDFFWMCNSVNKENVKDKKNVFKCIIEGTNFFNSQKVKSKDFNKPFQANKDKPAVNFLNKPKGSPGEDAMLISPNALNPDFNVKLATDDYNDDYNKCLCISKFIEIDPKKQIPIWKLMAKQLSDTLNGNLEKIIPKKKSNDIYLNTHGTGIFWLHIRLDTEPNYYSKNNKARTYLGIPKT